MAASAEFMEAIKIADRCFVGYIEEVEGRCVNREELKRYGQRFSGDDFLEVHWKQVPVVRIQKHKDGHYEVMSKFNPYEPPPE